MNYFKKYYNYLKILARQLLVAKRGITKLIIKLRALQWLTCSFKQRFMSHIFVLLLIMQTSGTILKYVFILYNDSKIADFLFNGVLN